MAGPTPEQLRAVIEADPELSSLAEEGRDNEVSARLNVKDRPGRSVVTVDRLAVFTYGNLIFAKLLEASETIPASVLLEVPGVPFPIPLRLVARTAVESIRGKVIEWLDMDLPQTRLFLAVLQMPWKLHPEDAEMQPSVLLPQEVAGLLALGDAEISQAEAEWGAGVEITAEQVEYARTRV